MITKTISNPRNLYFVIQSLVLLSFVVFSNLIFADRVKDIATLAGVRDNQLVGYGLVVGLDGSGDKTGTQYTEQSFRNMLVRLGINIPVGVRLNSKNIAAVMVTANLKSFMKKGQKIDVNVSSIGDATSLRAGTLLMTPLKGADGKVYAIAQGNLIVGGLGVEANDGSSVTINVPSGARIPSGATVERNLKNPFASSNALIYNLHRADFTTAKRLAQAINQTMGPGTARAIDSISVQITAPKKVSQRVDYVSFVENIELLPAIGPAKVIVNSRTGTVIIGQKVKIGPAAVSHGAMVVTISQNNFVSQPAPLSQGQTQVVPRDQINVQGKSGKTFLLAPEASLKDIVRAINAVGAGPGEIVAILEALRQVGALNARLVVM